MMDGGPMAERIVANGVPVHSLGMRRGVPTPTALTRLTTILRAQSVDVLQTWLYGADLLGAVAARRTGTSALVWNVRCSDVVTHHSGVFALTRWTCARFSTYPRVVITNSEAGRAFHAGLGYQPRRWAVISNGVDLDEFKPDPTPRQPVREELGVARDALLIGLVARVDPLKDHATFIQAAGRFVRSEPRAQVVLVGLGASRGNASLMGHISRAGLSARVHLLGRRADVSRILAALDIACLSSITEGFPNVVAEAMACEVPCVVTDVGDASRIVADTGVVVPPRDPAALAGGVEGLIRLCADGRARLGRAGRARIRACYELGRMVHHYEDIYESLAGNGSSVVSGRRWMT